MGKRVGLFGSISKKRLRAITKVGRESHEDSHKNGVKDDKTPAESFSESPLNFACPNCEETVSISAQLYREQDLPCPKCAFPIPSDKIRKDSSPPIFSNGLQGGRVIVGTFLSKVGRYILNIFFGLLALGIASMALMAADLNYTLAFEDHGLPGPCQQAGKLLIQKIDLYNQNHEVKIRRLDLSTIDRLRRDKFFQGVPDHHVYPAHPFSLNLFDLYSKYLWGRIKGRDGKPVNYENYRGENLDRGGKIECIYHQDSL